MRKTVDFPQVQFLNKVLGLLWCNDWCQGQTVQKTLEFSQFLFIGKCRQCGQQSGVMGFWALLAPFFALRPWTEVPIFQPSSAHSCECSRAPGVPESLGVDSQVTRHSAHTSIISSLRGVDISHCVIVNVGVGAQ